MTRADGRAVERSKGGLRYSGHVNIAASEEFGSGEEVNGSIADAQQVPPLLKVA